MAASDGRRGRPWRRLVANVRATHGPCCRCGQAIDYSLAHPDPMSFSTDHYPHPLSTHPHLAMDPGNLKPAHLVCNQGAGDSTAKPQIGATSRAW